MSPVRPRGLIFQLHLYLGLTIGLFLASSGITGSILVWRNEIDALLHPELLRVVPAADRMPLQSVVDVVRAAYPGRGISMIQMPRAAEESVELTLAGSEPLQVYVDPYR